MKLLQEVDLKGVVKTRYDNIIEVEFLKNSDGEIFSETIEIPADNTIKPGQPLRLISQIFIVEDHE